MADRGSFGFAPQLGNLSLYLSDFYSFGGLDLIIDRILAKGCSCCLSCFVGIRYYFGLNRVLVLSLCRNKISVGIRYY